ncbi:autotransporter outer membrane beta-barrel domain-containing protein [Devosia sp. MC532]|uniref:autotransporter family protein n=1 Tax=Devosia sp. MC532 TaxID=2799788 RepID=UPI0018F577F7|nr:autotransporter outer membrane beta-barrel domain-containing protein [Devosia sp. MC532]MBJ7578413.1 autotransporter outer membrane beta-barrel domain-containing protein [Devosia sp. MC532]
MESRPQVIGSGLRKRIGIRRENGSSAAALALLACGGGISAGGLAPVWAQEHYTSTTTGDAAHGYIQFSNQSKFASMTVSTSGAQADGVRIANWGPQLTTGVLTVQTTGVSADGILLPRESSGGTVRVTGATTIDTADGMGARAVASIHKGTNPNLIELAGSSAITTLGNGGFNSGYAVFAGVNIGGCFFIPADCVSNGAAEVRLSGDETVQHRITTSGKGAHGVYALGRGHVEAGNVTITVNGANSAGVVAARQNAQAHVSGFTFVPQDYSGSVNLAGNVTISATGPGAVAMIADSAKETSGLDSVGRVATIRSFSAATQQRVSDKTYTVTGDLVALRSGVIDLEMGNGSRFTGAALSQTNGLIDLVIDGSESLWSMTENSDLSTLALRNGAQLQPFGGATAAQRSLADLVTNGGVIDLAQGEGPGKTLTINGNYVGAGGTVVLGTVLAGDDAVTDRMVVTGGTSGNTLLAVRNFDGPGALTVNGINVVEVAGPSEGSFQLLGDYVWEGQQAVIGGAYAYTLHKGGAGAAEAEAGNWYLRSAQLPQPDPDPGPKPDPKPVFQPGAPLFEAYPNALLGMINISTLRQRVGNRAWSDQARFSEENSAWMQVSAGQTRSALKSSTTGASAQSQLWGVSVGGEAPVYSNEQGTLVAGLNGTYALGRTNVSSVFGSGVLSTEAFGFGVSATWYDKSGFYLDAQGQLRWMRTDISSHQLGLIAADQMAFGYGLSLEGGYEYGLSDTLSLIPQAQVSIKSVSFNDIGQGTRGGVVTSSLTDGGVSELRLGIGLEDKRSWKAVDGTTSRSAIYAVGNFYYDLDGQTSVSVGGVGLSSERSKAAIGVGIGGTLSLRDDTVSLYGQIDLRTPIEQGFGSVDAIGKVGLRVAF